MTSINSIRFFCEIRAARFLLPLFLFWLAVNTKVAAQNFWQPTNGPYGGDIRALAINNSTGDIFAGTNGGGIFRSTDDGETWTNINNGLTNFIIQAFAINSSGYIFAGTNGDGVFLSTNNGENWTPVNTGLTDTDVVSIAINSAGHIFAGTSGSGVFRSVDDGKAWKEFNNGLPSTSKNIRALAIYLNNRILAGTNDGVFLSCDSCASWRPGLIGKFFVSLTIDPGNYIFAGTSAEGVFRSTDEGATWNSVNTGLTNLSINALAINSTDGDIFAGTNGGGVFRSTNSGSSWTPTNTGLRNTVVQALTINSSGHIFAGTSGGGIFRSTDSGSSWTLTNTGLRNTVIQALAINSGGHIFAGTRHGGVFRATDNGDTWMQLISGLTDPYVISLAINSSGPIFAGTKAAGVFRSTNNGESWIQKRNGLPNERVESLAIDTTGRIFAGMNSKGIFHSTNDGESWTSTDLTNTTVLSFVINHSTGHIFAGTGGRGVFRFTNDGESWMPTGLTNATVFSLVINDSSGHIFAGADGGEVFHSIDHGNTWTKVSNGLTNLMIKSLAINSKGDVFAGTDGGIFRLTNNGDTWTEVNTGLTNTDVFSLAINANGHVFAGTNGAGVFRTTRKPRSFTHTLSSPHQAGQRISIEAEITNEVAIWSATLQYRMGGSVGFITMPMTIAGDSIKATIPAELVTSRGVEYFIVATDVDGFKSQLPPSGFFSVQVRVNGQGEINRDVQGNPMPQPNGSEESAYRLFSVPLDLDKKNPKDVLEDDLGPYDNKKWRFYELRADHPDQPYVEITDTSKMVPGKAFWLIVKEAGKVIDTGPGVSTPTDKRYAIALYSKWNFVANPFNFSISANTLRLKSSGQPPVLRYYTGSWSPISTLVTVMEPFEGYAVFNSSALVDTLFVNADLTTSINSLPKELPSSNDEKILWSIRILAQCQEARDGDNLAAITSKASDIRDEIDQPEPPIIGEYVSVYFPHREWNTLAKTYCIDARPEPTEGEVWEFEVKTNIRDKVHLTFEGIESVPPGFEIWLADDALRITQNLREINGYTVAGSEHPKNLKLVVGKKDFIKEKLAQAQLIPTHYELSQNFPNPFNPVTTIRYGLPQAERVTLKIYSVLGEEVATLADDEQKAAGYHVAIWDGRDRNGVYVASGVYVYRVRAGGSVSMSKKLALVK